jgi:hypothetical protein
VLRLRSRADARAVGAEGEGIDLDEDAAARCAVAPRGADDAALWALRDTATADGAAYKARTCAHACALTLTRSHSRCHLSSLVLSQIASCAVHAATGALLLDPRDAELLDEHLQYRQQQEGPTDHGDHAAGGEDDADGGGAMGGWSDDDGGGAMEGLPDEGPAAPPLDAPGAEPHRTRAAAAALAGGADGGAAAAYASDGDASDEEDDFDPWAPLDFADANGA